MDEIKDLYRIQYRDNTYQYVQWNFSQFHQVFVDMDADRPVTIVEKTIFRLSDIRAIVYVPVEDQSDIEKDEPIVETPEGAYTSEMYNLLVDTGLIPPVEGGND